MEHFTSQPLSGWGRYPVERCHVFRPDDASDLNIILDESAQPSYVARGLGRSYGDTSLNAEGGVISFLRLNRVLSFDEQTGVLECEAGLGFAEIIESFLPCGFFLPVSPGTKFVTVGGAIANDVHGKNHHREGSFANFVLDLTLLTAQGDVITCSPDRHREIFWATVGGIGLTGLILRARIRLQRVASAYVVVDYDKARDVDRALELFSAADDDRYQYSVAWVDCLARGRSLGRAVLMRGNHAAAADLKTKASHPLAFETANSWTMPFDLPAATMNRLTIKTFNAGFYHFHREGKDAIVAFDKYFYPLDAIRCWNRLYGRRGFVQYQVAFPPETSRTALIALLERLSRAGRASFLAVLKRFGAPGEGLLSFPIRGFTLALDLPMSPDLPSFLRELDMLVLEHGGRVYLAKDAVTTAESFARMYPALDRFKAIKRSLDPKGLYSSSMARRLRLCD